jgi:putative methyltransferase (TIGR04325 family)
MTDDVQVEVRYTMIEDVRGVLALAPLIKFNRAGLCARDFSAGSGRMKYPALFPKTISRPPVQCLLGSARESLDPPSFLNFGLAFTFNHKHFFAAVGDPCMAKADLLPPWLVRKIRLLLGRTSFYGNFPDYATALANAQPYTTDLASHGARVHPYRSGETRPPHVSWAVLTTLLLAASRLVADPLRVVDFGGGVGDIFFEARSLFQFAGRALDWQVIDLEDVVRYGTDHLQGDGLSFHLALPDMSRPPDVVIAAGVLQYLPEPYATLRHLIALGADWVVLNRTPVLSGDAERQMIQRVPSHLGGGHRPLRLLSESRLLETWAGDYAVLSAFDWRHSESVFHGGFRYMSYILGKRGVISLSQETGKGL